VLCHIHTSHVPSRSMTRHRNLAFWVPRACRIVPWHLLFGHVVLCEFAKAGTSNAHNTQLTTVGICADDDSARVVVRLWNHVADFDRFWKPLNTILLVFVCLGHWPLWSATSWNGLLRPPPYSSNARSFVEGMSARHNNSLTIISVR
jgi:hypothetical protein